MTLEEINYPIFPNPKRYMKRRGARTLLSFLKTEERALNRCLNGLTGIRSICDVPSGPGHLFPFWKRKGFRIYGADISGSMVHAAQKAKEILSITFMMVDAF
jgi:2-polyprenyl-3-methyl-5-hydroxy-6-metoxy-1,4-benzoquinol methylase